MHPSVTGYLRHVWHATHILTCLAGLSVCPTADFIHAHTQTYNYAYVCIYAHTQKDKSLSDSNILSFVHPADCL